MNPYYEVAFYGEINDEKDLAQIKILLAKMVGKEVTEINHFFSGTRIILKKCPTHEHAKKYADLFEKIGANVHIETTGAETMAPSAPKATSSTSPVVKALPTGSLKSARALLAGGLLLVMGIGVGFWIANQYFAYQNLAVITPINAQHPIDANTPATTPSVQPEPVIGIDDAITEVEQQIRETEAEDQKYAGGLIKVLMGSRLATLRQTQAMLQQRARASLFRIGLRYHIDGKVFAPPEDAAIQLGIIERELAEMVVKIAKAETDAARYSGGLVQALSLSTVAQMKQTQAMLDQKRLALKFSLPQYIGFKDTIADSPVSDSTTTRKSEEKTPPQEKQWRIVEIDSRVTESNSSWWRYAWQLKLANDSQQPMVFDAKIEFQDADGFVIDQDNENGLIPASAEKTFTGYKLISVPGAMKVQKTMAKVSVR